jgi:hypothetical protein
MHVRVMRHGRSPGVQHRDKPDARSEPLGIGGDPKRRLRRGLEQDAVDRGLVLVCDVGDASGQRLHHMEIGHGQKLGLALGEPLPRGASLTLRAMAVAAAVECDERMPAPFILAARNVAASRQRRAFSATRRCAAALDG